MKHRVIKQLVCNVAGVLLIAAIKDKYDISNTITILATFSWCFLIALIMDGKQ